MIMMVKSHIPVVLPLDDPPVVAAVRTGATCPGGWQDVAMELHPIMYVPDQYAERDFYEMLGFQRHYEGDEFPGFIALRNGSTIFGLQRASDRHPPYATGLRWQFEVNRAAEIQRIISVCVANDLVHEVVVEEGGDRFLTQCVKVRSPAGIDVWFEGPNEAG